MKTTALIEMSSCRNAQLKGAKAEAAAEYDKRLWQQSVANRIEGRRKAPSP